MPSRSPLLVAIVLVAAACAPGVASAGDASPPPIDTAIAQAKASGKPLLIEFFTTWCGPCKMFEAKILPDPAIQRALGDVTWVRYDAERGPGVAAASRFGVSGYPTFLVLDEGGQVVVRNGGVDTDPAVFLALVRRATIAGLSEDKLRARLKASPADATLLLSAARWYDSRKRGAEAVGYYDRAIKADGANKAGVAADATWEVSHIRGGDRRREALVRDAADFARRFPASSHAYEALEIAVFSGDLPAAQTKALVAAYVTAHLDRADALNAVVYLALAAGVPDEAQRAAERQRALQPDDANPYDTLAEVLHHLGQSDRALALSDEGLRKAKPSERGPMQENRERFVRGKKEPWPDADAPRQRVQRWLAQASRVPSLDGDGNGAEEDRGGGPEQEVMAFYGAMRGILHDAAAACSRDRGKLSEAYVRFRLGDGEGPPRAVVVLEPDATPQLKKCLAGFFARARLPKAPLYTKGSVVDAVRFDEDKEDREEK